MRIFVALCFGWVLCGVAAAQCPTVVTLRAELSSMNGELDRPACPGILDSLSEAYHALSVKSYTGGELDRAIEFQTRAAEVQEQLYRGRAPELPLGKSYYNLGRFYLNQFRPVKAARYLGLAVEAFRAIEHPESLRRRYNSLKYHAIANQQLGRYDRAEQSLQSVLTDSAYLNNNRFRAEASTLLGDLQLEQGRFEQAVGTLSRAVDIHAESGTIGQQLEGQLSLANALYKSGDYDRADVLLRVVRQQIDRQMNAEPGSWLPTLARATSTHMLVAAQNRDFIRANEFYLDNVAIAGLQPSPLITAQVYDNGAEIALLQGEHALAIERIQQSLAALIPGFNPSAEQPVPARLQLDYSAYQVDLHIYLGDYARILAAAGRPHDALKAIEAATYVSDNIRDGVGGSSSSTFWRGQVKPLYERAIALSLGHLTPERAFPYFERSRSILLLEALLDADRRTALPDSILTRLEELEGVLNTQRMALVENKDSTMAARNVQRYVDSIQDYRAEVIQRYPNTLQTPSQITTTELEEFKGRLSEQGFDQSLQYFLGEERAYVLSIVQGTTHLIDLGPAGKIKDAVRDGLAYFADARGIAEDEEGFRAAFTRLYQLLLAPALSAQTERLLIVPDGVLAYLPFNALIDPEADQYLIENCESSYAQSATVWAFQIEHATSEVTRASGFAPFTEATAQDAPLLLSSGAEMDLLAREVAASVRTGSAATKETMLQSFTGAHLLHFATHAYAARSAEEDPRILAADGPIYLPEIYALRANQNLITLSACNSNIGEDATGEGVLSLGRAFTAAGASSVVASLWALNDRATAGIMERFYADLQDGVAKPTALRNAQLNYLNNDELPDYQRTPYYWAALTYYGEPGHIQLPSTGIYWWFAAGILALVAVGGFFRYRTA